MKHEFHNPDNLTPEQIGEGYRLLLKSEIKKNREENPDIQCWISGGLLWGANFGDGYCGSEKSLTYRVPLSTWPLPKAGPQCSPGSEGPHGEPTDWISWHGGECPLKDDEVEEWEYKMRSGKCNVTKTDRMNEYWCHEDLPGDIIAYRVLKWKKKPARESPPTDNDAWECLLRTNADLGREVSELKKQRDALSSQLQGVITACHLRGYNVGDSLGEWIEKQFEDALANLTELLRMKEIIKAREVNPLLEILRECALHVTREQDCIASDAVKALSTFTSKHKI